MAAAAAVRGVERTVRRAAVFATVMLVAGLLPRTAATAATGDDALDLQGTTPVEYAIAWSQQAHPPSDLDGGRGPEQALIGRDDLFADGLASAPLQDAAPLLLTPSDGLSSKAAAEIERLGVSRITILGGEQAISPAVENALTGMGLDVERLHGPTRTETAIAIAQRNDSDTALLLRSTAVDDPTQEFVDSLAAGGWAAQAGLDVLLTRTDVLTQTTADHLAAAGYQKVIIVGGPEAVSPQVEQAVAALVPAVERVAGPTRFETAVAIAHARGFRSSVNADVTFLIDGQDPDAWADGLPAAHLAASGYPIVLADSVADGLPGATRDFLVTEDSRNRSHLDNVDLICGSSVPDGDSENESDQCAEAAELMGLTVLRVPLLGDFTVTIDPASVEQGGRVTIEVGGLAEGDEVVISGCGLQTTRTVSAGDIDGDGDVTFSSSIPQDQSPGDCDVSITVNGQEIGPVGIQVTARAQEALPAELVQVRTGSSEELTSGYAVEIDGAHWLVTGSSSQIFWGTIAYEDSGVILFNIWGDRAAIPGSGSLDAASAREIAATFVAHTTEGEFGPEVDWPRLYTALDVDPTEVCGGLVSLLLPPQQGGLMPGFDADGDLEGTGDFFDEAGGRCSSSYEVTLQGHIGS